MLTVIAFAKVIVVGGLVVWLGYLLVASARKRKRRDIVLPYSAHSYFDREREE